MSTALAVPQLAYPGPRSDATDGRGNGRGEWDWWYDLPTREQNRLRYHMSHRGSQPDVWAHAMGYDSTEEAMRYWQGLIAESRSEWDMEEPEPDEIVASELVGPGEVAILLGVQRATIRQWRKRGQMPAPILSLLAGSGKGDRLPVWRTEDIIEWAQSR